MEGVKMVEFRWRKDAELLAEAKEIEGKLYEIEGFFMFGFQLGCVSESMEIEHLHFCFRPPNLSPDAVLYRDDTGEVINIEFESVSSNLEAHGHPVEECDLIVCRYHDEKWENPIPVYETSSLKLHPPKREKKAE